MRTTSLSLHDQNRYAHTLRYSLSPSCSPFFLHLTCIYPRKRRQASHRGRPDAAAGSRNNKRQRTRVPGPNSIVSSSSSPAVAADEQHRLAPRESPRPGGASDPVPLSPQASPEAAQIAATPGQTQGARSGPSYSPTPTTQLLLEEQQQQQQQRGEEQHAVQDHDPQQVLPDVQAQRSAISPVVGHGHMVARAGAPSQAKRTHLQILAEAANERLVVTRVQPPPESTTSSPSTTATDLLPRFRNLRRSQNISRSQWQLHLPVAAVAAAARSDTRRGA